MDGLEGLAGESVPKADVLVGGAAAAGEKTVLVRRPGYRFYSCHMVRVPGGVDCKVIYFVNMLST